MLLDGRGGPRDVKSALYHIALGATSGRPRTEANAAKLMAKVPEADAVRVVQEALAAAGQDPGPVDGVMGERTKAALQAYRAQQGMDATDDVLDPGTLIALLAPSRKI